MSRRIRTLLVLVGLLLVIFSLAALVFAFSPVEVLRDQTPIAPTLFALPPGAVP